MSRILLPLIAFTAYFILLGPALAAVQEGDACARDNESSMINGKYLICSSGIWVGQAPQVVNIGLSNAVCNATNMGLLRVKNITLQGNTLQFCDGTNWKMISLL